MNTLIAAGIALVGLLVIGVMLAKLYRRSTKERAFVRTGVGGQKVVLDGGALVLPIFHEIIDVNLNTLRLLVSRINNDAMISKDSLRVNVAAEFYVRVKPDAEAVAIAAQTLGSRTLRPEDLSNLIEAKLVDGLRSVAAGMDMMEMHQQRAEFVQKVQQTVANDLTKNGLELESVSLTGLDQTPLEYFKESNTFDAIGRAKIADIVETKRFETTEIQNASRVRIAENDREAAQKELLIKQELEFATLEQEREVQTRRAGQEAEIANQRSEARKNSEAVRIATERDTRRADIESQRDLEVAEQDRQITLSRKSEEESAARAKADQARAEAVTAEEGVKTAQATAVADREKKIALISAQERAEQDAIKVRVEAEADRDAATARAQAKREEAQADADAEKLRAEGIEAVGVAEAKTIQARNEAINTLKNEHLLSQERTTLMGKMSEILEAAGKPIESIDSINVMDVSGLGGLTASVGAAGSGGGSSSGNLADDAVGAALRYRTSAPLIDGLLKQIGVDGQSLNTMVTSAFGAKTVEDRDTAQNAEADDADDGTSNEVDEATPRPSREDKAYLERESAGRRERMSEASEDYDPMDNPMRRRPNRGGRSPYES